jgi:hypothetical protein
MRNIRSSARSSCVALQALRGIEGIEGVITGGRDEAISPVNGHKSIGERRQHPRDSVVGRLEDITYSVLRDYELIGEAASEVRHNAA